MWAWLSRTKLNRPVGESKEVCLSSQTGLDLDPVSSEASNSSLTYLDLSFLISKMEVMLGVMSQGSQDRREDRRHVAPSLAHRVLMQLTVVGDFPEALGMSCLSETRRERRFLHAQNSTAVITLFSQQHLSALSSSL